MSYYSWGFTNEKTFRTMTAVFFEHWFKWQSRAWMKLDNIITSESYLILIETAAKFTQTSKKNKQKG